MTLDEATDRLWQAPFKQDLLRWSLTRIVEVSRQRDIAPVWVLVTTPGVQIPQAEIDALVEIAVEAGFIVLDLGDVYGDTPEIQLRLAPWDDHPNARAHRLIADRFYSVLSEDGALARIKPPSTVRPTDRQDRGSGGS
jgi:hypothetical protein